MPKIEHVLKSRKEYTCGKCGCVIENGKGYFRANRMYQKPIIHCEDCGIKPYEIGNEYTQQVGAIAEEWRDNYGLVEETIESIAEELDSIRSYEEEKLDNLGENLRYSPNGELFQESIDNLDEVISNLECIDISSLQDEEAENFVAGREGLNSNISTYEELIEAISDDPDTLEDFEKYLGNAIGEAIDEALEELEY